MALTKQQIRVSKDPSDICVLTKNLFASLQIGFTSESQSSLTRKGFVFNDKLESYED